MFFDIVTAFRHSSRASKTAAVVAMLLGLLYSLFTLLNFSDRGPIENYTGFMRMCASTAVLPVSLIVTYAFTVRYGPFDRVRRNPHEELMTNLASLIFVSLLSSLASVLLFSAFESATAKRFIFAQVWQILTIMMVQLFMMCTAVGLLVLFFANSGVPFNVILPVVITVLLVARWFLLPFAASLERYFFYFWYPIGPRWSTVFAQQVVPFFGFCIVLVLANLAAFEHTDRLEL